MGIREDMQGPSLMLKLPVHAQSPHRQAMCHWSAVTRPLRPHRPPQQMQTQTLLSRCVRGRLYSFPPLSDACADLEGGSDFYQTIEIL